MRIPPARRAAISRPVQKLNDLFVIFPDLPWPRVPKRPLADQIRSMDRRVGAAHARARFLIAEHRAAALRARGRVSGPDPLLARLSPGANRLAWNLRGQAWRVDRLRRRIHELSEFRGSRTKLRQIVASLQEDADRLSAAFVERRP